MKLSDMFLMSISVTELIAMLSGIAFFVNDAYNSALEFTTKEAQYSLQQIQY